MSLLSDSLVPLCAFSLFRSLADLNLEWEHAFSESHTEGNGSSCHRSCGDQLCMNWKFFFVEAGIDVLAVLKAHMCGVVASEEGVFLEAT